MSKYKKIIAVKVGWCETYNGDVPKGEHGYLKEGNIGHETFNFKKYNNQYFGYIPPKAIIEKGNDKGWLVVSFALKNGKGPLCLVGWHENSTISSEDLVRPEYSSIKNFPLDSMGDKFFYHFKSKKATCLPISERDFFPNQKLSKTRLGSAKVAYLRGHKKTQKDIENGKTEGKWRKDLSLLVENYIVKYKPNASISNETIKKNHNIAPPDEAKKKAIEKAAIKHAKLFLKKKGFNIINSREHERGIGYDLQAIKRKNEKYNEWHVEVKGTSLDKGRFFLSKNEYNTAKTEGDWRLILVEKALTLKPRVRCFTWNEAQRLFNVEPLSWYAEEKVSKA